MRALYRDEVVEVDRQIARVLRALDDRDLADRTLVVVVSDHGEEFWDHGGVEHGHTLYDELLRAVWLMRWPQRLPAGRRIAGVASTVDVTPTVQHIAGLDVEAVTDGVSLLPQIDGEAVPARAVLSENLLFAEERVAVRTDTAKLIRWENGKEEAYDLVHDPGEQRDLAATAFAEPLRFALEDVEKGMAPAVTPVASAVAPAAALRALGYLQ
jgi:arylsulfatase A-like enzyme